MHAYATYIKQNQYGLADINNSKHDTIRGSNHHNRVTKYIRTLYETQPHVIYKIIIHVTDTWAHI